MQIVRSRPSTQRCTRPTSMLMNNDAAQLLGIVRNPQIKIDRQRKFPFNLRAIVVNLVDDAVTTFSRLESFGSR